VLKKIAVALSLSLLIIVQTAAPSAAQSASETALAAVRRSDASAAGRNGNVPKLTPAEHMRRAAVYLANRAFAEARAHWQALADDIDAWERDRRLPTAQPLPPPPGDPFGEDEEF